MLRTVIVATAAVVLFNGCEIFGGGGGGGGGTGGGTGTTIPFTTGFTFVRKDDRNVYLVDDADTQTAGTLTASANVRTPSFSKDKQRIVFVRGTGESAEIAVVPAAGGMPSIVLTATAQMRDLKTPVFSPDGSSVAFSYTRNGLSEVAIVNVDGTGLTPLAANGVLAYASPTFSADGASVVVAAGSSGLALTQVERITLASGSPSSITNTLGSEALDISGRIVVSPNGALAVFDGRVSTGETRLFVLDLTTRMVTRLYPGELGANDSFPCWVNDTTVAFSSDSGGNDNVYSVTLTSNAPTLLVPKAVEPWYSR